MQEASSLGSVVLCSVTSRRPVVLRPCVERPICGFSGTHSGAREHAKKDISAGELAPGYAELSLSLTINTVLMNPAVVGLSLMVAAADVFDMSERARAGSTPTVFSRADHSFPHADPSRAGPSHSSSHLLVRHCNGCVTLVDDIFCLTKCYASSGYILVRESADRSSSHPGGGGFLSFPSARRE